MSVFEKYIRRVEPYVPGDQPNFPDMIKLNTNENPYPPSPEVQKAIEGCKFESLRLYPDPTSHKLNKAIADRYGLNENQVFTGVGSDDVIAMCFLTFFNSDKPLLFPDITYAFYPVWAQMLRTPYELIPLNDDFEIVPGDYYRENGGIIFPNPNAPTGALLPLDTIEDIIKHNPDSIVIVDEAYIDFGGQSAVPLIEKYDNLIVIQTFSKSRALAGMRIGYAMGNESLIKALHDVKYSFNSYTMNRQVIEAGAAAVMDEDYFQSIVKKIIATRERCKQEFSKLGFKFKDSMSNFLFVTHPEWSAKELFEALKNKHIFVRYLKGERTNNYLRITIGTDEEMNTLFEFLRHYKEEIE
ncbi:MAG: histidinol-phosphate transaminase [Ruminococcus sp.]|nr:histidinol-phosphate transaminase [Ruminococcus sp.]